MTDNIIQTTLAKIYPEFEKTQNGDYGNVIPQLLHQIFESCGDNPVSDVDFQMSALVEDIEKLKQQLINELLDIPANIRNSSI